VHQTRSHFDWLKPLLAFLLPILAFLTLSRLALLIWQFDRVANAGGTGYILLQGLRFDLVILGMLLVLPSLLLPLLMTNRWTRQSMAILTKYYFLFLTAILVFMEMATPNFIIQFDFRPNILSVEYLKYPKEIVTMLVKAVPLQLKRTGLKRLSLRRYSQRLSPKEACYAS